MAETGAAVRDYTRDPRTCTECKQNLFPNFMEGTWEHFAKGCKYSGCSSPASNNVLVYKLAEENFAGPFRSELVQRFCEQM